MAMMNLQLNCFCSTSLKLILKILLFYSSKSADDLQKKRAMMAKAEMLELKDIDAMIKLLTEKRFQMEADACLTEHTLLQDFLAHLKRLKDDQLLQLKRETSVIQSDLERISDLIQDIKIQSNERLSEQTTDKGVLHDFNEINASTISPTITGDFSLDQDRLGSNDSTEGIMILNIIFFTRKWVYSHFNYTKKLN